MIDLTEFPKNLRCPNCSQKEYKAEEALFCGMHTLVKAQCPSCQVEFYGNYPIGHGTHFQVFFTSEGKYTVAAQRPYGWFVDPLIRLFKDQQQLPVTVEKTIYHEKKNVVILNCLDSCYGHVFLKLLNAQRHLQDSPEFGIVLIIPKSFEWLIPEGIAEVWSLDIPVKALEKNLTDFNFFVKQEIKRFEKVFLSKAFTHLDTNKIDLEKFVKTKRFDLAQFSEQEPVITFVLRQDRFWINNKLEDLLFKISIKYGFDRSLKSYFIKRQNRLMNLLVRRVIKEVKNARFFAVGIGNYGKLNALITDETVTEVNDKIERHWCSIYAKSHLVIGIHGSNMLIPTSLSAGFVEILPRHKIPHLTEDAVLVYNNRYQTFLGRHLDQFSDVKLIVKHMISMLRDFPYLYSNTEEKSNE